VSRIDDLIEQLCPDGVEFKTLGEMGTIFGGLTGKSKVDFSDGNARFISYINVFTNPAVDLQANDSVRIGPSEKQRTLARGDVLFTGSSETPDEVAMSSVITTDLSEPLYLNSFCIGYRLADPETLDSEFAKHLFRSANLRTQLTKTASGVTRFNVSKVRLATVRIPVPPLEVQREIAQVLDLFSFLEAELEAELENRRLQYAHYRDSLVSFSETGIRWMPLGEIANVRIGQAPPEGVVSEEGPFAFVNAGTTESGRALQANTPGGAVTIPSRGQGGVGVVGYQAEDFWCGPLCYRIVSADADLSTRFLYYYLKSVQPSIRGLQQTGGTPALNRKELILVKVPVPPLQEQERTVGILDKFDALVNDLSIGLPAELNARRKQYRYYRDRLLAFKELAA
jgi:type I restriction enzyme S subunit